jgi:hypothetical protein
MPILYNISQTAIKHAQNNDQFALSVLYHVCKIFYIVNQIEILSMFNSVSSLQPWLYLINSILLLPDPSPTPKPYVDIEQATIEHNDK